ncbi:SET domain-containing protein SmydA-8-like isoform X2 [Daktulosphaira vitifoliae]|nr:SET domain-containing protein SmydA-8-like isoform X2 [Daktulosphaira vitifoliae]
MTKRNINEKELILCDDALVMGPLFPKTDPVCIKCLKNLSRSNSAVESLCELCLWPICSTKCDPLNFLFSHQDECNILAKAADLIAKSNKYRYEILTPLRCILLQIVNKNNWNRLIELQSHLEHRGPKSEVYTEINSICNFLKQTYLRTFDFDTSEETIHKICGILDVNALDVQLFGIYVSAIYPTISMLEHNCLPNIRLSYDKHGCACIYAARKIEKGEHLSTMYTNALWGTRERRDHLMSTKYFNCSCKRCSSRTELGTHFSTVICNAKQFCKGNLTPVNPLYESSEWECDKCPTTVSSITIDGIIASLSPAVEKVLQNPSINSLEIMLEKLSKVVHTNHYMCFNVKHTLIQMYGHLPGYKHPDLTQELLERKLKLCREMFSVLNIIDPLYVRLNIYTAVVLFELHLVLIEFSSRIIKNKSESEGMIDEAKVVLLKAIDILQNEPEESAGYKLLQVYKSSLTNNTIIL